MTAAGDPDAMTGLEVRWDDDYDGTWDTTYAAVAPRAITRAMPGRYPYKVRARNATGRVAEAVLWVQLEPAPEGCGCRLCTASTTVPMRCVRPCTA